MNKLQLDSNLKPNHIYYFLTDKKEILRIKLGPVTFGYSQEDFNFKVVKLEAFNLDKNSTQINIKLEDLNNIFENIQAAYERKCEILSAEIEVLSKKNVANALLINEKKQQIEAAKVDIAM